MSVDKFKNIINKKNMKKILILLLLLFINPSYGEDFQKIYDGLETADFEFVFGIDPYQAEEYTQYMFSPYPLLRIGVNFIFKDIVIPPGYYLLTPRKYNGKTYLLFKEQGKVKYMIPVYNIDIVPEHFYEKYNPKPKTTKWQKFKTGVSNTVGTMFPTKTQRKPVPESYLEINDIDGDFFQVILYYGDHKYYTVFKQDS